MLDIAKLDRTKDNPWKLKTTPGTAEFTMHTETKDGIQILVCTAGQDRSPRRRALCLRSPCDARRTWGLDGPRRGRRTEAGQGGHGEARGRSPKNPMGGWCGLKKGLRGRFGVYVPPLLEALGDCVLEHNPKSNRMRAKWPIRPRAPRSANSGWAPSSRRRRSTLLPAGLILSD